LAATPKAVAACKPAKDLAGECPLVFSFAPDGSVRNVYFASGYCEMKAPPLGDCVVEKLSAVRIPPFDNVDEAEVGLNLVIGKDGSVKAVVDE
jgi:hypothetical protein